MLLGICANCGKPAKYTCAMCSRVVCELCFDFGSGVCIQCRKKVI